MATTMFHWALHPWAIYAVVGIAIAYGTFRKGRSQLISAAFAPLIGKRRSEGPAGRVIDILAIFATLFGSAASLGLGALQIGAGLEFNGWVDSVGKTVLVSIIVLLTIAFIASAVSGVAKGIQWLSNINMVLALLLAAFVFVVGPTLLILNLLPTALGDYADQMTVHGLAHRRERRRRHAGLARQLDDLLLGLVGLVDAVRRHVHRPHQSGPHRSAAFVTGVLLVPSLVSLVWFAVFGGAAIHQQRLTEDLVGEEGAVNSNSALFAAAPPLPDRDRSPRCSSSSSWASSSSPAPMPRRSSWAP